MSAESARRRSVAVILCTGLWFALAAMWYAVVYLLYFYTPRLRKFAEDSGTTLSSAEMLLARASSWYHRNTSVGGLMLFAGLAVSTYVVYWIYRVLAHDSDST